MQFGLIFLNVESPKNRQFSIISKLFSKSNDYKSILNTSESSSSGFFG